MFEKADFAKGEFSVIISTFKEMKEEEGERRMDKFLKRAK